MPTATSPIPQTIGPRTVPYPKGKITDYGAGPVWLSMETCGCGHSIAPPRRRIPGRDPGRMGLQTVRRAPYPVHHRVRIRPRNRQPASLISPRPLRSRRGLLPEYPAPHPDLTNTSHHHPLVQGTTKAFPSDQPAETHALHTTYNHTRKGEDHSMTTINNMEDLIRILEERPEWRAAARGLIVGEELAQLARTGSPS